MACDVRVVCGEQVRELLEKDDHTKRELAQAVSHLFSSPHVSDASDSCTSLTLTVVGDGW